ncbi:MAG: T9SS C-terminal target domain-containing protein, partial [Bacteroidia bacterium]
PAIAGVGNHVIVYTYTDPQTGCVNTCQFTINVHPLPVVNCPHEMTVYDTDPPFPLSGATPAGGEYSGKGVELGSFYPAYTGIGPQTVTYTYTDPNNCTNFCTFTIIVLEQIVPPEGYDFGDAPDEPYPTLLSSNGARHFIVPDLYLGQGVDPEPDGQPCPFALGDDQDGNDDEDGVRFLNSFVPGENVTVEVSVQGTGYLNAWFDWDADGSWGGPFEHTIVNQQVTTGIHHFNVNVPATAKTGFTFTRFRLTSQPGLSFQGPAPDGEVEDYRILINEPEEHKMHFPQYPDPAGWDVNFTYPQRIADDWMCSETGYVEDFHFWVSWKNDHVPDEFAVAFVVMIYSDIPADESPTGYSMPGEMLWARNFVPGEYTWEPAFEHPQGYFDPSTYAYNIWDHLHGYRIDITNFAQPFLQIEGTIYWLVVTAFVPDPPGGGPDTVVVTLDGIDPAIGPYELWTESGVVMNIQDHPGAGGSPASYGIDTDGVWLYPALLHADLGGLPGAVIGVEVDVYNGCEAGCTAAMLYQGTTIIDAAFNTTVGIDETLILSNTAGFVPDKLTISSFQGKVMEIRLLIETEPGYIIGWKTSLDHFNDVAVWQLSDPDIQWGMLTGPVMQDPLSLAFVITGSPAPLPPYLNLEVAPAEGGTVSPAGYYQPGTIVTVSATANEGYLFVNWSDAEGEEISSESAFDFTMPDEDVVLTANFVLNQFQIFKSTNLPMSGMFVIFDPRDYYEAGDVITIEAIPWDEGFMFLVWTGQIEYVDDQYSAMIDVTMPAADVYLTANFVNLSIPDSLAVSGLTITSGEQVCFEARKVITVNDLVIKGGAIVHLAAGEKIRILPHTYIEEGAQFRAYIDPLGVFCYYFDTVVASEEIILSIDEPVGLFRPGSFFKVYPNPTEGVFTLELETLEEGVSIRAEIFGLLGGRIYHDELPHQRLHTLDLTGHQPGLYIIRVTVGNKVGIERLIKR